jgi:predicted ATPase
MAQRSNSRPARRRLTQSLQLEKVRLRNIRAIKDQAITFRPLTVVVGGNSAGKSTLLKSILLIAQAQRDVGNVGEVRLNGRLVTLDKFDAVIRNGRSIDSMSIEMEFVLGESLGTGQTDLIIRTAQQQKLAIEVNSESPQEVHFGVELEAHPSTRGSAAVRSILFRTEAGRLELSRGSRVELPLDIDEALEISDFAGTLYPDESDSGAKQDISGVVLNGLIPLQSAIQVSLAHMLVEEVLEKWQPRGSFGSSNKRQSLNPNFVSYMTSPTGKEIEGVRSTEKVLTRIAKEVKDKESPSDVLESLLTIYLQEFGPENIVQRLIEVPMSTLRNQICADLEAIWIGFGDDAYFESQSPVEENLISDIQWRFKEFKSRRPAAKHQADWMFDDHDGSRRSKRTQISWELRRYAGLAKFSRIVDNLEKSDKRWRLIEYPRLEGPGRMIGASQLSEFFLNRIHYVGPLRRGPETVTGYRMRGAANQVGVDGENLAYLLTIDPTVLCPIWAVGLTDRAVENSEMRLQEALSYWMQQLQLAEKVTAREEPGIGDMIRLKMKGMSTDVSPNDVGVGVSQAMPVLAAVLLAKPGDLIILEQPELHLHPNAQLALADFFLAATRSGRRILIESHSEHFLSRIRLRSVETADNDAGWISKNVGFIFAEPELEGSDTGVTFREVEVTTTGEIDDWPVGFFDQGPRESRRIFIRQQESGS